MSNSKTRFNVSPVSPDAARRRLSMGLGLLPMLPLLPGCGVGDRDDLVDARTGAFIETGEPGTQATASEVKGASQTGRFRHPGLVMAEDDFTRIRNHIAAGDQPWTSWWNKLCSDGATSLDSKPNPQEGAYRATNARTMYWDIQRAWCLALRWKLSNDKLYADKVVETLDAWSGKLKVVWTKPEGSSAHEDWTGWLMAGMQGHQWAQVGELMRTYSGWAPESLARFQNMLVKVFVGLSSGWLSDVNNGRHLEAHANWDLAALCGTMAIGVFCDRHDLYLQAYDYYTANVRGDIRKVFGNGAAMHNVYFMHPGHLGQWQESGRDQGHATLGMSLGGVLLEMAWNQGDDLYGLHNNRFLAAAEYVARSNLKDANDNVYPMPFANQRDRSNGGLWSSVNQSFQHHRDAWELIHNHYVNRMGLAAPNVARMVALCEPNYWSGNGDDMVFPTLTHRRAPYAGPLKAPSGLTVVGVQGRAVLSWWGSAGATAYQVGRSAAANGPFTAIGTVKAGELLTLTDTPSAGTWFYRVTALSADKPDGGPTSPAVRIALPGELRFAMQLNDGSGNAALGSGVDGAGNKLRMDGVLAGGAAWGDGRSSGKAVAFDGKESYVQLPPGLFKDLGDFTIAMWTYVNALHWDSCLLFVGQDGMAYMRLVPQGGHLRFAICAASYKDEQAVDAARPLPTGRWVHVAVTLQGTKASLYVDGKLEASQDNILLSPRQLGDQLRLLGRDTVHPAFNGRIQDFRLYSGALSAAEIASLVR